MHSKARLFVGAAVVLLFAATVGGAFILRNDSTSANDPVLVTDGSGVVQEFKSLAEAEAFVSEKAGFAPVAPSVLPEGFRVTELGFNPPPPRPGSVLQRVTYKMKRGASGFTFLAVNRAFDFPGKDAGQAVTTPSGATLYRTSANAITEYTLVTQTRGWVATVPDSLDIEQAEIARMFDSLPAE